ncbi:MAG: hypothetical protein EOP87_13175 [Verrucomicrobiaceae bacterium]|nr:MAG: hypothetical protein EOP87_13175 [Verrucomicrobiaceae bacterium]
MIKRFQIEDLVVQDTSGVVFRAFDTETETFVALRRFFPDGPNGSGLDPSEQASYNAAVDRLAAVSHPALRSVICGGCDPVDGMPFIVTEWIEGTRLKAYTDQGPLAPHDAAGLLTQALEVCQILSEVLDEQAVWIETGLQAIVVSSEEIGRGVTFWISPLKCLGKHDSGHGLEPLVVLTENIMGWAEKNVPDQAAFGLGGWYNWLKKNVKTATLLEAREKLAASVGSEPPVPTRKLVQHAARRRPIGRKKGPSGLRKAAFILLIAAGLGGGGWFFSQKYPDMLEKARGGTAPSAAPLAAVSVLNVGDHEKLMASQGKEVTLEGTLSGFGYSDRRTSLYLLFSKNPSSAEARGRIVLQDATADMKEDALAVLVGKKIRVNGELVVEDRANRPVVPITSRDSIQEVK